MRIYLKVQQIYFLLLPISLILAPSCNFLERKNERALAKAYKKVLLPSEVKQQIPFGISSDDSIRMANKIINDWARTQAIVKQAKKYLEIDQKEIEKKTLDYKNELIVYAYEKQLISEKLDTTISSGQVKDFFEKNKPDFNSENHLIKVVYAVVPNSNSKSINFLKNLFFTKSVNLEIDKIIKYCSDNEINHSAGNQWISINQLNKIIPLETDKNDFFSIQGESQIIKKSGNTYFFNILDYHSKDEEAIWEFEEKKIRSIIINKRKRELLQNIRKEIYNAARDRKEIEVFENR